MLYDYVYIGDTSQDIKAVSLWVTPQTTTEVIADFDGGTHVLRASAGTLVADGFVSPRIFVDNEETTTISATRHHIIVMTNTAIDVNDLSLAKSGADYGEVDIDDFRIYSATLTGSSRQLIYDVTVESAGSLSSTYSSTVNAIFDESRRTEADDYWNNGFITMTSGALDGEKRQVKNFVSASGKLEVFVKFSGTPSTNDTYTVTRGCNKTARDCKFNHNNWLNYGGFEMLPRNQSDREDRQ